MVAHGGGMIILEIVSMRSVNYGKSGNGKIIRIVSRNKENARKAVHPVKCKAEKKYLQWKRCWEMIRNMTILWL